MTVSELYRYPVKSLGGQRLESIGLGERGFEDDRRWMFVDDNGTFISQRSQRRLAKYRAVLQGADRLLVERIADGVCVARVDGARPQERPSTSVDVWGTRFPAVEVHYPHLAELTVELGIPGSRLVYMNAHTHRPVDRDHARAEEEVSFADGFPYLVVSEESLAEVSRRYGSPLDVRRFRPNIVVSGEGQPFAEDDWGEFYIGGQPFYNAKPCARCGVITHDPDTGEIDRGVQRALSALRRTDTGKVLFGINCCWTGETGELRVGDAVRLTT